MLVRLQILSALIDTVVVVATQLFLFQLSLPINLAMYAIIMCVRHVEILPSIFTYSYS